MLDDFIGRSPAITKLKRLLPSLSQGSSPLIIIGKAGVGKHLFASHIHALSGYQATPPEILNFSLLSDRDQRISLFGGGPPDLTTTRRSILENSTTVILKYINHACRYYQDQLADSLKRQLVVRAGTNEEHPINCRVIFTLPESPSSFIRDSTLSPQLGDYLDSYKKIFIPSLSKRLEDIPVLIEYFCRCYREKYSGSHISSQIDINLLQQHRWTENIRELKAFIRGQILLDTQSEIICTEKIEIMKMLNMLEEGSEFSLPNTLD